ncbi:MAG: enoyl-CoA hydratase/isomerase family protein [Planctomycetota bacterium]|nr:enoyl-CoA hydratase/isomerase family protein [Planctomycetota bacterium]
MTYETILTSVEDGIGTITLNRPDVFNAINKQMVDDLHAALEAWEQDDAVRAVILTSAGGKAFMSGADIAEMRERRREDALKGINSTLFSRLETFPRPTVAAVVGWCLGGGCELAMTCDFRVAGETSKFGQPEVGLGIMAAAGATRRLPALVGLRHARRLLFSGAIIDAQEAASIGLVDEVVPNDQVQGAAKALLAPILKQAPEAVKRTKQTLLAWLHGESEADLMRRDNATQADLFEHPDKFERMTAFLERKKAKQAKKAEG